MVNATMQDQCTLILTSAYFLMVKITIYLILEKQVELISVMLIQIRRESGF